MSDLRIKVAADTSGAEQALQNLGRRVQETGSRFGNFSTQVAATNKGLNVLPQSAAKVGEAVKKMGSDAKSGGDRASQALLNFGRIAQDAPYGIIGISNNINPLLESFQRLKAETGSTGGALKALAGSFIGPAGLGVAVSIVTGLLSYFALNARSTSESVKTLADDNREFFDSLKDVESGALATGLKLQEFVRIARDGNLPLKVRNEALRETNKILGEHGEKLTLANINTQAVTESIQKFTQATIQQALANKLADRAADLLIKQRDAQIKLTQANEANIKSEKALSEAVKKKSFTGADFDVRAVANLNKAKNELREIDAELENMKAGFQSAQRESTMLFGSLGFNKDKNKTPKEASKKSLSEIENRDFESFKIQEEARLDLIKKVSEAEKNSIRDRLSALFSYISGKQTLLSAEVEDEKKQIKDKLSNDVANLEREKKKGADIAGINEEIRRITINANEQIKVIEAKAYADRLKIDQQFIDSRATIFKDAQKQLVDQLKQGAFAAKGAISKGDAILDRKGVIAGLKQFNADVLKFFKVDFLKDSTEVLIEKFKAIHKVAADQSQILFETVASILGGIGSGIGDAIAGSADVGDVFRGVFNVLGSGVKQLGEYILKLSVLAKLAKLSIKNPITGIAAGVGLIALGSLIQSATKKNAFATGVSNFQGGYATVGERGPEVIALPRGSSVIPNAQANAMSFGQQMVFIPDLTLRGSDLVVAFNRQTATNSRNG